MDHPLRTRLLKSQPHTRCQTFRPRNSKIREPRDYSCCCHPYPAPIQQSPFTFYRLRSDPIGNQRRNPYCLGDSLQRAGSLSLGIITAIYIVQVAARDDGKSEGMNNGTSTAGSLEPLSKDRVETSSVNIPLAQLPATLSSEAIDAEKIADDVIHKLNTALSARDYKSLSELFLPEHSYWRDHIAASWDTRTLKGREKICSFLTEGCLITEVTVDKSSAWRKPQIGAIDGFGDVKGVQFYITFETEIGRGRGVAKLAEAEGKWLIFTLFTSLEELKGHEEPLNERSAKGVEHGGKPNRKNWQERRNGERDFEDSEPAVLIIGKESLFLQPCPFALLISRNRRRTKWSHGSGTPQDARR